MAEHSLQPLLARPGHLLCTVCSSQCIIEGSVLNYGAKWRPARTNRTEARGIAVCSSISNDGCLNFCLASEDMPAGNILATWKS